MAGSPDRAWALASAHAHRVACSVSPRRPEGGAQVELLVVPEASVVAIPAGVTLQQAATLPMNGLTAKLGLELLCICLTVEN